MAALELIWTAESLDRFLADPRGFVPGTTMTYAGVPKAQDRADIIAFLQAASADPLLCPP